MNTTFLAVPSYRYTYLSGLETSLFDDSLEVLGSQGSAAELRPSLKHQEKIQD